MTHSKQNTVITIETVVDALIGKVWKYWTEPQHIMNWNNALPDWYTPAAENDIRVGKKFKSTMAAKDGSMSFDFSGTYTDIKTNSKIAYTLDDGRKIDTSFIEQAKSVKGIEHFETGKFY